jgi:hypothetical protein
MVASEFASILFVAHITYESAVNAELANRRQDTQLAIAKEGGLLNSGKDPLHQNIS